MTIWARDVDTGEAKWVYQMTPWDQWDYDGINEMILADINVKGKPTKALVHFDRNGFGYTLDRTNGALLVAEKYDPKVNWATHVDMKTGRPQVIKQYAPGENGVDHNNKGICPAALGSKDEQPASFNPTTRLFYVPTNHVCMDYEPFKVDYVAGQPYVGATLSMFPPEGERNMGNFIAWDAGSGKIVKSHPEKFSVWSGALNTAGGITCYGTLEGYLKSSMRTTSTRSSSSSRRRRASSAMSSRMSTRASNTWACTRASAAGPASAWQPDSRKTRKGLVRSAATRSCAITPSWAVRSLYLHCRSTLHFLHARRRAASRAGGLLSSRRASGETLGLRGVLSVEFPLDYPIR